MSQFLTTISSRHFDLAPLANLIASRFKHHFNGSAGFNETLDPFDIETAPTSFLNFIKHQKLSLKERLLIVIALAPHISASFYDGIIKEHIPDSGDFPELGGMRGKTFRGFLPTGETALLLLAGQDPDVRLEIQDLFSEDHLFAKKRILWLEEVEEGEPRMSGRLVLSSEYVDLFTTGTISRPRFSMHFPAQLIETRQDWDDLVLHADTRRQIQELEMWINHGQTLLYDWGMSRKLKPGYRALFHGPPGTGKTLTASLLGKYTSKDVYRIDLSMIVSKFIGETEKNLSNLFAKAENKNWILFFDEADALFGKRTNVRDAHDKYANQEVSYLLQRVEQYCGLVILATNFKSNIDDAFMRRFQSTVYFPPPGVEERMLLWQKAFPEKSVLAKDVSIPALSQKYELTGAEIVNVVQYASLRALDRGNNIITYFDIYEGIQKEFFKEGKVMR